MNTLFIFTRLRVVDDPSWATTLPCLSCLTTVPVRYGEIHPVLQVEHETLGVVCGSCLTPVGREKLAQLRHEQAVES